jgi:signal peptidase I
MPSPETESPAESVKLGLLRALLARHGTAEVMARGHSMLPLLEEGDLLGIEALPGRRLRRGDIVAYLGSARGEPHVVIHRVIELDPLRERMLAKGDSLKVFDVEAPLDSVLGRVVYLKRGGRTLDLRRGARNPGVLLYVLLARRWARTHRTPAAPEAVAPLRGGWGRLCSHALWAAGRLARPR